MPEVDQEAEFMASGLQIVVHSRSVFVRQSDTALISTMIMSKQIKSGLYLCLSGSPLKLPFRLFRVFRGFAAFS